MNLAEYIYRNIILSEAARFRQKDRSMNKENLSTFILRNRFQIGDFVHGREDVDSLRQVLKYFPEIKRGNWFINMINSQKLEIIFSLIEYVSHNKIDEKDSFSDTLSDIDDERWKFILRFAPYHKVHTALENLNTVHRAMVESCLGLNAALGGMDSAVEFGEHGSISYDRERSLATSCLLNLSALYASYIDVCRRIAEYGHIANETFYRRSISRLIKGKEGQHAFLKDLRNFILHYRLVEPNYKCHIDMKGGRSIVLYLDSHDLLYVGKKWSAPARAFLQKNDEVDILKCASQVTKDVDRIIQFHDKLMRIRLKEERYSYEFYLKERAKIKHVQKTSTAFNKIFRQPDRFLEKLVDSNIINLLIKSDLSNERISEIIIDIADPYRNVPNEIIKKLSSEISHKMKRR